MRLTILLDRCPEGAIATDIVVIYGNEQEQEQELGHRGRQLLRSEGNFSTHDGGTQRQKQESPAVAHRRQLSELVWIFQHRSRDEFISIQNQFLVSPRS